MKILLALAAKHHNYMFMAMIVFYQSPCKK